MSSTLQLSNNHAEWLERERCISAEIAAQEGCVTTPGGVLAFTYTKRGQIQYVKAIITDGDGKRRFQRHPKGRATCLWGIDTLAESSTAIIVEGEFDRLALLTAGAGAVVSVPDGAQLDRPGIDDIEPIADKAFSWLWDDDELIEELRHQDKIILAVDGDRKGRILRGELAVRLGRGRCYSVRWPDGSKDANDVLRSKGPAALLAVIDAAEPIVPDTLVCASAFDGLQDPDYLALGVRKLDDHLVIAVPSLIVISGPPNSGKSQFALWVGSRLVSEHAVRVAYMQFEDAPVRNIDDLRRYAVNHVPAVKNSWEASAWIEDSWRFICPSERDGDRDFDLDWLEQSITTAATRHGCRCVILDPWNELEHLYEKHETASTYLNRALRRLKQLGRRLRIALIIVAHPDKSSGINNKKIADWSLYSIDGGAAWNNKADLGIMIVLDDDKRGAAVAVTKSKDWSRMGTPGTIHMTYVRGRSAYMLAEESTPRLTGTTG